MKRGFPAPDKKAQLLRSVTARTLAGPLAVALALAGDPTPAPPPPDRRRRPAYGNHVDVPEHYRKAVHRAAVVAAARNLRDAGEQAARRDRERAFRDLADRLASRDRCVPRGSVA